MNRDQQDRGYARPREGDYPGSDPEQADHDQPPGWNRFDAAGEGGDERKYAIDEREGAVQQH